MAINGKEVNQSLQETIVTIAHNAKRIRMESGFTQKMLCKEIGCYHQLVQRIESGNGTRGTVNVPAISTLIRISMVCNVCITEFFKPIPCQTNFNYTNTQEQSEASE